MSMTINADLPLLIVDDEPFSRMMVERALKDAGFSRLLLAGDGAEAQRILGDPDNDIRCVISDFRMPRMNGLELLKAVRIGATGAARDMPFAMLTAHADGELVDAAIRLDVNAFLTKPVVSKPLAERLERVLTHDRYAGAVEAYDAVALDGVAVVKTAPKPKLADPADSVAPADNQEQRWTLDEVPVGSVLSRGIATESGATLLGPDMVLTARVIEQLKDYAIINGLGFLWVRR